MEEFNVFARKAQEHITSFETLLATIEKAPPESQEKSIKAAQSLQNRVNMSLENCGLELNALEGTPFYAEAQKQLAEMQDKSFRLQTDLQFKSDTVAKKKDLFGSRADPPPAPVSLYQMDRQRVIGEGDRLAQDGRRMIDQAYGKSENAKEVASGIEIELQQQDEQIDRVRDKTEDMRSKLKAANKVLDQIYRRYLTDKIIICLIVCILIVIVFLVIYGAAGMDTSHSFNTGKDQIHT